MKSKLFGIFATLKAGDVITTITGDFVVCREVNFGKGPYSEEWRYVIGKICSSCNRHCQAIFPTLRLGR